VSIDIDNLPSIHDDTSPVYVDYMKGTLPSLKIENFDKIVGDLKTDFDNSTWLVRNADVVFKCASVNLQRMTVVCLVAALLATLGGLGAAFCSREYKKTRFAFACLTVASAALSIFAALTLSHMHAKASYYSGFFERRWS
jgi:hypothetical protein